MQKQAKPETILFIIDQTLDNEIVSLFEKLSKKQEPLGRDFEKILFDNLWDLYQS